MIESSRCETKTDADRILKLLMASTPERRHNAIRIGICGAPGAGKSSLIEKLGMHIVKKQQKRLAVLAIDPSSERSGGSILGDKTRMDLLSQEARAFIRPSPTRGVLGGVALNTGEV
jgi:LAO/AO transport system kinase